MIIDFDKVRKIKQYQKEEEDNMIENLRKSLEDLRIKIVDGITKGTDINIDKLEALTQIWYKEQNEILENNLMYIEPVGSGIICLCKYINNQVVGRFIANEDDDTIKFEREDKNDK